MGSLLGFRGPHFSEEEAWLPGWLQQCEGQSFGDATDDGESCFEKRLEELQFLQENSSAGANAPLLSCKEYGYRSCHLFLSADSSSPFSSAQSTEKVVRFNLHLSIDSSPETMASLVAETSQIERPILSQILEAPVAPERECDKPNVEQNADTSTSTSTSTLGSKRSDDKDQWKRHEEAGICEDDISSAIEFSIAASEAMVIHEVVRSMSTSDYISSSAVLEVALQLKQARMETCQEAFSCPNELHNEDGFLSDLDDVTMRDAFNDIGLSATEFGDKDGHGFNSSWSKEIIASSGDRHYKNLTREKNVVLESDCGKSLMHLMDEKYEDTLDSHIHVKDLELHSFGEERENTLNEDPAVTLDTNRVACRENLVVHHQHQENPDVSTSVKTVRDVDLLQVPKCSPLAIISKDAGQECAFMNILPDQFQSRWYGGWTWKEVKASAPAKLHNESIPKPFIHETSFLSESADVAPDQNSVVQRQHKENTVASQASITSESHNKANYGQDAVRSSGLSPIDSLCSIVPCSISSENVCATSSANHEDEVLMKCYQKPTTDEAIYNVHKVCCSGDTLLGEKFAVADSLEGLQPALRQEFTSPRTCTVLLHRQEPFLENERYDFELEKLAKIVKSNLLVMQPAGTQSRDEQRCDEPENDGADLPAGMQKKEIRPLILYRGTRRRLQASNNVNGVVNQISVLEQLPDSQTLQRGHSNVENQITTPVPERKRVRFSENNVGVTPKEKFSEQRRSLVTSHKSKADKKVRRRDAHSGSRTQERIKHPKHHLKQDVKRQIFRNMEFLLTGFSCQKEKEIENLIELHGGVVLLDVPSPSTSRTKRNSKVRGKGLPVVICTKKQQTIKFLYGCAVNAPILNVNWLTDSVTAGSVLPPQQYMILPKTVSRRLYGFQKPAQDDSCQTIFDGVGIMLLGKNKFCATMAKVIKHGGGQVFKTLQWLVQSVDAEKISTAIIVAEDETRTSRHLTQCALEQNIPVLPASWMVKSLHRGKLLPFKKKKKSAARLPPFKAPDCPDSVELSMEI